MKFDAALLSPNLSQIPNLTRAIEEISFDGLWVSETTHDPFLPLTLVAEHSRRLSLGTGIALAFPRSPAILAFYIRFTPTRVGNTGAGARLHL